ncbi:NAD(P)-binding protein [Pyrenochaeta sp. DS3sAY3a]|nr:NAD(P)-binding protein [Pyrenochaeta sp. DS3sAY3a]
MAEIQPDSSLYSKLDGKVVVITGGATGIGKSAVRKFADAGARVVFGDVSVSSGQALAVEIGASASAFVACDVSSYEQQLRLFAIAEQHFGGVDIVVANAGISDTNDIFDASYDVCKEPDLKEIDVNLKGVIYTAKIGMSYLRKRGGGSMVLVSSIAGFKESTHLTPYLASKHGILGVLRGLRLSAVQEQIFVNAICPWMTTTGMVDGIRDGWESLNLPRNEPDDVAESMMICATAETSNPTARTHPGAKVPFSGKIMFVAGGKSYEIEDAMQALEPHWLGQENSRMLRIGQEYLMSPETSWVKGTNKS